VLGVHVYARRDTVTGLVITPQQRRLAFTLNGKPVIDTDFPTPAAAGVGATVPAGALAAVVGVVGVGTALRINRGEVPFMYVAANEMRRALVAAPLATRPTGTSAAAVAAAGRRAR